MKLTISSARSILSQHGVSLHVEGREFYVRLKNNCHRSAGAYTTDLTDAVVLGKEMAQDAKREEKVAA